jgi:hypothetical protein
MVFEWFQQKKRYATDESMLKHLGSRDAMDVVAPEEFTVYIHPGFPLYENVPDYGN